MIKGKKESPKEAKRATMKPAKGKTWTDKVNDPTKEFQIKKLDKDFADMPAGAKMLIATSKIIDEYVRHIPKGKSGSLASMRKDLASEYGADYTCPVTSGIFLRIVSEAAHEQIERGAPISKVAPFWRVVDEKSALNKKLSFGTAFAARQRKKEGLSSK
ncbi:MAG: hypothetical protein ACKVOQ_10655 [Cyclobacteriaceae bacterium]